MLGEYDLGDIRAKSVALTELFIRLVDETCSEYGVTLMSPRATEERGSQVALRHPEAYASVQALIARGVVGDFRMPDVMRFGFAPLYICHVDVVRAVRILEEVLADELWREPKYQVRAAVT